MRADHQGTDGGHSGRNCRMTQIYDIILMYGCEKINANNIITIWRRSTNEILKCAGRLGNCLLRQASRAG